MHEHPGGPGAGPDEPGARQDVATFRLEDAPMARDRTAGWAYVRAAGEVFSSGGAFYLTSARAVQAAQRDPGTFSSARAFDKLGSPLPLVPIAVDPPAHVRYRRVLDPMLAPRVIATMEPELRRRAATLVDRLAARGECDLVADFARLYPTEVFLTLFGMPVADRDQFIDWAERIIEHTGIDAAATNDEVAETAAALFGYLQEMVAAKRRAPGDDLLSRILALSGDDAWTEEEVLGLCFLFTLAGLDTVTASIGFTFLHLAKDDELRRRVVGDVSLVPALVEEVLRLEPPAPIQPRITTTATEVVGRHVPAGALVNVVIGSANRDPTCFPSPDRVDLAYAGRGHFGFGGGVHRCLGAHLARQELRIVIDELHKRIPHYKVAPGCEPEVPWPSGTLHLRELPIVYPSA